MMDVRKLRISMTIPLLITIFSLSLPAYAKYSGGTGEPNDPYQIATAEDLILLGESPDDYDKHFILTADIDLDPNLPGRKVFDRAVIAPNLNTDEPEVFVEIPFTGVFDGNDHIISHLTIAGASDLGLLGQLEFGGKISSLGLEAVYVNGTSSRVGGLVGNNLGNVSSCYSTGQVCGSGWGVGGLVGRNSGGNLTDCYSNSEVSGSGSVGGLVGYNSGNVTSCYSIGMVSGSWSVGGLVGSGNDDPVHVKESVWDIETSGLKNSGGGVGLTTTEMMDPEKLGLNGFCVNPNWVLDSGRDYPRLDWEGTVGQTIPVPVIHWLDGLGTPENPFRIENAEQLLLLHKSSLLWDKHFVLSADIDLDPNLPGRDIFRQAVIPAFEGSFIGNGYVILNLQIEGGGYLGLFGKIMKGSIVRDLGLKNISVNGIGSNIGGLAGDNDGDVTRCYSTGTVSGTWSVGGLVGDNHDDILKCYSTGTTTGYACVGGMVGKNRGDVIRCYSKCTVYGESSVGGLIGDNYYGDVTHCYSISQVCGDVRGVGGLVGGGYSKDVINSFWDIETSGQQTSDGGIGKTTVEMQMAETFLEAGWDFVEETGNGTENIWSIVEGQDYPKLKGLPEDPQKWPYLAFCPNPQDGAIDVIRSPVLYWAPKNPTLQHDIYLGEIKQAVANATILSLGIYRGRQPGEVTTFDPGMLEMDKTYYWRIDEVNNTNPDSPWKGPVWSFTTVNFLIVDDFESYNDINEDEPESNRIYLTWIDGYDNPEINGSEVGEPLLWGHTIIHSGNQSMPFSYDNAVGKSEATANVADLEIGRDWTIESVGILSLWFRGNSTNAPETMYVVLNSFAGVDIDDSNATQVTRWTEWRIDLQEFADQGVELTNINSITIGFGNRNNPIAGGSGKMYFDDIRLYRSAP